MSPEATKARGWYLARHPLSRETVMRIKIFALVALVLAGGIAGVGPVSATTPRFYRDDPLLREPEPQDAGAAALSEDDLMYELAYNVFALSGRKPSGLRAQNVNTID